MKKVSRIHCFRLVFGIATIMGLFVEFNLKSPTVGSVLSNFGELAIGLALLGYFFGFIFSFVPSFECRISGGPRSL